MFENITQSQIQNEACREFEESLPYVAGLYKHGDYNPYWTSEHVAASFNDGFLAGMIWWKAVLVPDYDGPKSDLQIAVRKEIEPFFANKVLDSKSENEN